MNKDTAQPILVCRLTWMDSYASPKEKAKSNHSYVAENNVPWECLNFRANKKGLYQGYVRSGRDAEGKPGKIDIRRLGAKSDATDVSNVLVAFAALDPIRGKIRLVGFYRNATVFRDAKLVKDSEFAPPNYGGRRIVRFQTRDAELIPIGNRELILPTGIGGIGQSDLWYGLNDPQNAALRNAVLEFSRGSEQNKRPAISNSTLEVRKMAQHRHLERRTNNRRFIFELGFRCQVCDWEISSKEREIWGSSFELHHLDPISQLPENEEREVSPSDFAVLCASCHRAIHRTDLASDVSQFRKKFGRA